MNIRIYFILLFSIIGLNLIGQTANKTKGCAPLTVDFEGPVLSTYYWDFGDDKQSSEVKPRNIYSQPGNYIVSLRENINSEIIGTIEITVFEKPTVAISADILSGCAPLNVQFTNESIIEDNINVMGYVWNYGGQSSNQENPTATFSNEGTVQVVLRIEASEGCSVTGPEESLTINVNGKIEGDFTLNSYFACTSPATFTIDNSVEDNPNYTYNWDFGNGTSSSEHSPGDILYDEEGLYPVTLRVNDNEGCEVEFIKTVEIGRPPVYLNFPDSVCLDVFFTVQNTSIYENYEWDFGSEAFPINSEIKEPTVKYISSGLKVIKLSAYDDPTCRKDTTIMVFVEDPDASFSVDPISSCEIPAQYILTAANPNYATYQWTQYFKNSNDEIENIVTTNDPTWTYDLNNIPSDSFYINRPDEIKVKLTVTSQLGCRSTEEITIRHRAPEAYYIPSVAKGCAPLSVEFTDHSRSDENITYWEYLLDGNKIYDSNSNGDFNYMLEDVGEYTIQLIIENEAGCRDTSSGIRFYVGELIESTFNISQDEICLGDSIILAAENMDPRIDSYHFETDGDRVDQCYTSFEAQHSFIHEPGTYPIKLITEYNGCFNNVEQEETIIVNGAKSRIRYMIDCENPYTVMLQDSSVNAENSIWLIQNDTIDMSIITESFIQYTFDSTGNFPVRLVAYANEESCNADTSNIMIHIRNLKADFELPEEVCAGVGYYLDASSSVDVDTTCYMGYRWDGVDFRPRVTNKTEILGGWASGPFDVRLIVEDINGCLDTMIKSSQAYDLQSNFEFDKEPICLPMEVNFSDLSSSDTTLSVYDWNFNGTGSSSQENPSYTFSDPGGPPSAVQVGLIIEDAIGCKDTSVQIIQVYEPTTDISVSPSLIVCVGETIEFSATDFTEQGSSLDYNWNFGQFGNSTSQSPSILVDNNGVNNYQLTITEKQTGCQTTIPGQITSYNKPIASFDDLGEQICIGENKTLNNTSIEDGPVNYIWSFSDNSSISSEENPEYIFINKGTIDITLTVNARPEGCSDSNTQSIEVVGPEGDIGIDKDKICKGEEVTLELINPVDVVSYNWNFSGNSYPNQSPLIVEFNPLNPDDPTEVITLELESADGCKVAIENIIEIYEVSSDYSYMRDTLQPCLNNIFFTNQSIGAEIYTWDFGGLESTDEENPQYTFPDGISTYDVILYAQNGECRDTLTQEVKIDFEFDFEIPNVFSPNDDGINDFFDIVVKKSIKNTELDIRTCFTVVKAKIYDRWGKLIYDNELPEDGWDGRYDNGDQAPAEVYTYRFEIEKEDGSSTKVLPPGTITLIR